MNKLIKFFVAMLGGINVAFSVFIPITISLMLIVVIEGISPLNIWVITIVGILSSIYRAINVAFLRG